MFDKDAIDLLMQAQAITAANVPTPPGRLALPKDYQVHDIEKALTARVRQRGRMSTVNVADFAHYIAAHSQIGATVFINPHAIEAVAVLNLGDWKTPGHADDTAHFTPPQTAAYKALLAVAGGTQRTQTEVAEFLEDWPDLIKCFHDGDALAPAQAIAAIRRITIEATRKSENAEGQLSAEKSTFEKVSAASGADRLPTHIYFTCVPFLGLKERTFVLRLALRTGGDKPAITLRITKAEQHQEDMLGEFQRLVDSSINGEIPVRVGTYAPGA